MRIAIVGGGISGLGAAYSLQRQHDVTVFEAQSHWGGHTHTHDVSVDGRDYAIDTGFIVYNPDHYPLLTRLFEELGVASQQTTMSFSVSDERSGFEYEASGLGGLLCRWQNSLSPRFWRMLWDLTRFHRQATLVLDEPAPGPSLGEYLRREGYGKGFAEDHLIPMASALWSAPEQQIEQFPTQALVHFMQNHCMLQINNRPPWRVVKGGSARYIDALMPRLADCQLRLNTPVQRVRRDADGVIVESKHGKETFDQLIFACHSDQVLGLLDAPSDAEADVLTALPYQRNEVLLHTDTGLLPRRRRAWAAWNALKLRGADDRCTVSYSMNLLQGIESETQFVVTLNASDRVDPAKVLRKLDYAHPQYDLAGATARARRDEINGVDRIWYCGAYWGHGFHEDGLRSGVEVARGLGSDWP